MFFIWLLVAIFRNASTAYRNTADPLFSGLSLGYLAGFAAMLAHCIGSNTFIIVRIMEPFWFLTAMVIMVPEIEKDVCEASEAHTHESSLGGSASSREPSLPI